MRRCRTIVRGVGCFGLVAALGSCGSSSSSPPTTPPPSALSMPLYFGSNALAPVGGTYAGPAVVERSIARELVLAFDPDPATGGTLPRHVTILDVGQDLGPALFPVGAKVWLEKTPLVATQASNTPLLSTRLSVLTAHGGTLLLGVAEGSQASSVTDPGLLPLRQTGTSTRSHTDQCASGTLATTTFDVQGDAPVTIRDGETRAARVGGVDYDVGLIARQFDITPSTVSCADSGSYSWFAVSVRAHDLAVLASTLEVVQPPACALGNASLQDVSVGLFDVSFGTSYDGPVFYTKHESRNGLDCFQFNVPGLTALVGDQPPVVEACLPPGALAVPAVGEEFWATSTSVALATLRRANRGDLIAASVVTSSDFGVTSSQISEVLGTAVDVHPGCDYADYNSGSSNALLVYRLQEVTFGGSTPVVVSSEQHAVVPIGGAACDVWLWDSGAITIVAR